MILCNLIMARNEYRKNPTQENLQKLIKAEQEFEKFVDEVKEDK